MHRLLRFLVVVVLGFAIGVAGYIGGIVLTNPVPRDAVGWTLLAPLPSGRGETAAAVADGRLYVIGGMTGLSGQATAEVSVYDPGANSWAAAPALPTARHHAAAAALDGIVYVSGGGPSADDWTPQPMLWSLASAAEAWRPLAPMPEGRLGHRMVAVEGHLYVVGGIGSRGDVLIYDPETDAWTKGAAMPASRDHLAAVVANREIWTIGGRSGGQIHSRVDIYDTVTDAWHDGPPLPEATSGAAEAVIGGVILISGGEDPRGTGSVIDRHWMLDTRLGQAAAWEPLSPPPLPVHGAHGAALDGRFVIVGGAVRQGAFSRLSWTIAAQAYRLWSPQSRPFTRTDVLPARRFAAGTLGGYSSGAYRAHSRVPHEDRSI
jgi:N-acetylneuraminic acid mutarotase